MSPKLFLSELIGKEVVIKLKWGQEYVGFLVSTDSYTNVQLSGCREFIKGAFAGDLGEILIRCNNILHIRAAPSPEAETGTETETETAAQPA